WSSDVCSSDLPYLCAALVAEKARVVHVGSKRLLRIHTRLAKNVAGAYDCILSVGAGLALEGQSLFEVERDHRLLGELQHEVAQSADGDLLADVRAVRLVQLGMPAVHFFLGRRDQRVEQVVSLDSETLASRNLDVGLGAVFVTDVVA